ncbi:hypothetical protein VYU27_005061 [Nannochloropsis oceanica]
MDSSVRIRGPRPLHRKRYLPSSPRSVHGRSLIRLFFHCLVLAHIVVDAFIPPYPVACPSLPVSSTFLSITQRQRQQFNTYSSSISKSLGQGGSTSDRRCLLRHTAASRFATVSIPPNKKKPATPPLRTMSREAALEKWRTFVNDNLNDAGQNVRVSVRLADAMFDCGSVQSGKAGTFLIEEGSDEEDQAEKTEKRRAARQEREIFFLLDGQVRIQVRGQKVARLNQGDFLGEASFVTNRTGPRSVTAICSGETGAHYIVWNQAKLHAFLEGGKQGGKEGGGKVDAHASLSGQDHTLNELRNALTELWVRQLSKKLALTMATYER